VDALADVGHKYSPKKAISTKGSKTKEKAKEKFKEKTKEKLKQALAKRDENVRQQIIDEGGFLNPEDDDDDLDNLENAEWLADWVGDNCPTIETKWNNLSDDVRESFQDYKIEGYIDINEELRVSDIPITAKTLRHVENMDGGMAPSDVPLKLYRGIDVDDSETLRHMFSEGSEVIDNGYLSTSLNKELAGEFAYSNDVIEIRAPKGTKMMYMDFLDQPFLKKNSVTEGEFLLPRKTKLKVIGHEAGRIVTEVIK
jgi:hypothetical protein